jgi:glycosyltransferase involved in cell wall biosynthesis
MFQILKNFIFQQQRQPQIRLLPSSSSKGTVVLSYITWPFVEGWKSPKVRGHTNAFEVVTMARIYQELGFTVEIVDYNNETYLPPKECCIVIDLHGQLERWNTVLSQQCYRVLHATGAHWLQANQAELTRLAAIRDRNGVVLLPQRQVIPSNSATLANHITLLGNEYTMKSFEFAGKPIARIPISSAYEFPWPEGRDFSKAKKNFLWVGSFGMVHKGLDLVLEAFAKMPELSLTVCGRPEKEKDFFQLYEKELCHTSNIHFQGWIDMESPEFLEIAKTHAGIIYPSCSEGGGGSVIHCMHAGMVPICTRESSIDLGDFGVFIKNGTVDAVMEAAQAFAALHDQEVEQRAETSYAHVRRYHTRERFRENYSKFARQLLKLPVQP